MARCSRQRHCHQARPPSRFRGYMWNLLHQRRLTLSDSARYDQRWARSISYFFPWSACWIDRGTMPCKVKPLMNAKRVSSVRHGEISPLLRLRRGYGGMLQLTALGDFDEKTVARHWNGRSTVRRRRLSWLRGVCFAQANTAPLVLQITKAEIAIEGFKRGSPAPRSPTR